MAHPKEAWLEEITIVYDRIRRGDRLVATENLLIAAVKSARRFEATWQEIADSMGVTRQYAHKRLAKSVEGE
jgi:predicted transcriptional regulator